MNVTTLYPPPAKIDIGDLPDYAPPIFKPIKEYAVPNALINSYGYIFKDFRMLTETTPYFTPLKLGLKSVITNCLLKKRIKIEQPAISIMGNWLESFYHFTLESLVKLYVLRRHLDSATTVFHQNNNFRKFHQEWIEILELSNVTYIKDHEVVQTPLAVSCTFTSKPLNHHNIIIPKFREWILEKIENNDLGLRKIIVGRKAKYRQIDNLEELKKSLADKGFVYLEMEDYRLVEQINIFRNASEIVALHGAALTNLCFAHPSTRVIDLIHQDFNQLCFYKLSKILGIDYRLLRCQGVGEVLPEQGVGHQDLLVDIPELNRTINSW